MFRLTMMLAVLLSHAVGAAGAPRVGLALSGGGARGFAHIGVLQVLEEEGVPVDMITGTSMGAIVGGLRAAGYTSAAVETVAVQTDWDLLFSGEVDRRNLSLARRMDAGRYLLSLPLTASGVNLPRGLVTGQRISDLLGRMTVPVHDVVDFDALPIPFRCVATDIVSGEAVVIGGGDLAEALRASMAIPSVFTPVERDGRLLVDGMLVRNLPAQDARDLGADVVIGVDVGGPLQTRDELVSLMEIVGQATSIYSRAGTERQRALCDVVVELGVPELSTADFEEVEAIIAAGREAARAALPRILERIGEARVPPPATSASVPDSLALRRIVAEAEDPRDVPTILATLGLEEGTTVPFELVERAVGRVHGTGAYGRVTYRVESVGGGSRLRVQARDPAGDVFRFGLRYDTRAELAALFNISYRDLLGDRGSLDVDLILGERNLLELRYLRPSLLGTHFGLHVRSGWADEFLDVFAGGERSSRWGADVLYTEALVGSASSDRLALGFGLRSEWTDLRSAISSGGYEEAREDLLSLVSTAWYDAFDRTYFPTRGVSFFTRHEFSESGWGSDVGFTRHYADLRGAVTPLPRLTLVGRAMAGTSTGDGLPPHFNFILGGADVPAELLQRDAARASFFGLHARQRSGPHLQFLQAGIQVEAARGVLALLRGNVGNTFSDWTLDDRPRHYERGWGCTVAMLTDFGPLEATLARGSPGDWIWHLNFGRKF